MLPQYQEKIGIYIYILHGVCLGLLATLGENVFYPCAL